MSGLRIMSDFHHGGCARGLLLLLDYRLGHTLMFPDDKFAKSAQDFFGQDGIFMPCMPGWLRTLGGVPEHYLDKKTQCSMEEFMDTDWDAIIITRTETTDYFRKLLAQHPRGNKIKRIAMTGNDGAQFEWEWIKNFLCSDYAAYMKAPNDINKIWYSQELGMHYGDVFRDITGESLKVVNCFVQCWNTFTSPWKWDGDIVHNGGHCPHCFSSTPGEMPSVSPYGIWASARDMLAESVDFRWYGMGSPRGCIDEWELPEVYASGVATIHLKTYDGYGFSLLQSVACGRPVIVPRGFFRYRTAGKYLIPNLTCFEVDWDATSLANAVRYITEDPSRARMYTRACYEAACELFNWELEAWRVRPFMEKLC